jgi:hypothetical protein
MSKPEVTFEILRLIAESASGMRNLPTWFIIEKTPEGTGYTFQHTFVEERKDTVVIYCAPVADPVSPVNVATIGIKGKDIVNLMKIEVGPIFPHLDSGTFEADAVFWSLAAVEKFMVPYYASVYGDQGAAHAQAVMDLMRIPDTHLDADEDTEAQAFALVHLPSSEYVTEQVPHVAALRVDGRHTFVKSAGAGQGFSARTNGSRETYALSSGREDAIRRTRTRAPAVSPSARRTHASS